MPRQFTFLRPSFCWLSGITRCGEHYLQALGCGVTRSKRLAQQCMRKAAETDHDKSCLQLATHMYMDLPYAREIGNVEETVGVATSAHVTEGHDVPREVLTSVVHWLRKGGHDPIGIINELRRRALDGAGYCRNEGCEVVGHLKDFKVCPQCKTAGYCGDACQKQDWTTGGHKGKCGTFGAHSPATRSAWYSGMLCSTDLS